MSSASPLAPLTDREHEIAGLIARGLPRKSIAGELGISVHTVNAHCDSISSKLSGAGRFAVRCTVHWLAEHSSHHRYPTLAPGTSG